VLGAIAGAYLLQWPADRLGWAWQPETAGDARPLGGRTVVGGLLGGWLAVEWAKRRHGVSGSTGDRFAAPLAAALACGRIGCALAGCCVGEACEPAWWAWHDAAGVARVPVAWFEAIFHGVALMLLMVASSRAARRDRRGRGVAFPIYMATYAALRFALEFLRPNPPLAVGLSWYQWLALTLFALSVATTLRRLRCSAR
jgi:phosphatidylglycerol:prolipoprotein diacylglycerol transferase